jgi:hypothetical protein
MFYGSSKNAMRATVDVCARLNGIDPETLAFAPVLVPRGGGSLHDGRTWHGSGPNRSAASPRRGVGIHFVPARVRFKDKVGRMWQQAQADGGGVPLDEDFPVTWLEGTPTTPTPQPRPQQRPPKPM